MRQDDHEAEDPSTGSAGSEPAERCSTSPEPTEPTREEELDARFDPCNE